MNPPAGSPDLLEPAGPTDPDDSVPRLARNPTASRSRSSRPTRCTTSAASASAISPPTISACIATLSNAPLTRKPDAPNAGVRRPDGERHQRRYQQHQLPQAARQTGTLRPDEIGRRRCRPEGPCRARPSSRIAIMSRWRLAIGNCRSRRGGRRRSNSTPGRRKRWPIAPRRRKPTCPRSMPSERCSMAEHPEKLKMPLQAFRIGDAAIATMPCEIFCEIGLDFKKRSPLQPAWLDLAQPRLLRLSADATPARARRLRNLARHQSPGSASIGQDA